MLYVVVTAIGITVALVVLLLAQLVPAEPREVRQRLVVVSGQSQGEAQRRRREERRRRLEVLLQEVGSQFEQRFRQASETRRMLWAAGFRHPRASELYWGGRILATAILTVFGILINSVLVAPAFMFLFLTLYFAGLGWFGPALWVSMKRRRRQKDLQKTLPDALDLMVVCVEAGLGLNQALLRVAREIGHISEEMSKELALVNLEIRAGAPRAEALQNLADRTGLSDIQSLVTMLVQTDRFGTSIARSLRVHSDTVREKRRQAAEEAAAKTTIKLVFPLVIFIFPALLLVILGGGIIKILETLSQFT